MPAQRLIPLVALACLILLAGCSGGKELELVPVEGVVTLDGQPLADAIVIFRPDQGRPSQGRTDSTGRFDLKYTQEERGALPGHHKVTISTFIEADDDSPDPLIQQGRKEAVPSRYNKRSTLEATLPVNMRADLNFPLKSK